MTQAIHSSRPLAPITLAGRPQVKIGDVSALRQSNYLRRIPEDQWRAIIQKIEEINHPATEEELLAFEKGKWWHSIFGNDHWPYIAFHGFLEGKLTQTTLNRLFLYQACKKQAPNTIRSAQLYNDYGIVL